MWAYNNNKPFIYYLIAGNTNHDLSDMYKKQIIEEATIYKGKKREVTQFESHVNKAAVELWVTQLFLTNMENSY